MRYWAGGKPALHELEPGSLPIAQGLSIECPLSTHCGHLATDKHMPTSGPKFLSGVRRGRGAKDDYLRPVTFVLVDT